MMPMELLPTTVVAAVLLFVLRELLEVLRARRVGHRRRIALRTLLARECELNDRTIRRLRSDIQDAEDNRRVPGAALSIAVGRNGQPTYRRETPGGGVRQSAIPQIRKTTLEAHLLEIATLDSRLFAVADEAFGAISSIDHLRDGFIYRVTYDPEELAEFCVAAIGELDAAFVSLSKLYGACAGKMLESRR
jgi:hypothetical protein